MIAEIGAAAQGPGGWPRRRGAGERVVSTAGVAAPLGAAPDRKGTNFSVFSRHATGVELLLFDRVDDAKAARAIRLDPAANRTYHYWHAFVPGVTAGQIYGYRVEGPVDPSVGLRFDPARVLLDPYGRAVAVPARYDRDAAPQLRRRREAPRHLRGLGREDPLAWQLVRTEVVDIQVDPMSPFLSDLR